MDLIKPCIAVSDCKNFPDVGGSSLPSVTLTGAAVHARLYWSRLLFLPVVLAVSNSELVPSPQFFEYGPQIFCALYIVTCPSIIAILWFTTVTFVGTHNLVTSTMRGPARHRLTSAVNEGSGGSPLPCMMLTGVAVRAPLLTPSVVLMLTVSNDELVPRFQFFDYGHRTFLIVKYVPTTTLQPCNLSTTYIKRLIFGGCRYQPDGVFGNV